MTYYRAIKILSILGLILSGATYIYTLTSISVSFFDGLPIQGFLLILEITLVLLVYTREISRSGISGAIYNLFTFQFEFFNNFSLSPHLKNWLKFLIIVFLVSVSHWIIFLVSAVLSKYGIISDFLPRAHLSRFFISLFILLFSYCLYYADFLGPQLDLSKDYRER